MLNKVVYTILGFSLAFIFIPRPAHDSALDLAGFGATAGVEQTWANPTPELAANPTTLELSAKSALAQDFGSGSVLYAKNLDEKLPTASLTKLMTALIVVEKNQLDHIITIRKQDQTSIGNTMGLVLGEQISVLDLLKGMLIASSNDAALALAQHTAGDTQKFVQIMNDYAEDMGLNDTRFSNPIGWDSDDNYSNALDLMKLATAVIKHPLLGQMVGTREAEVSSVDSKYVHRLTTTNRFLLEDENVIGVKTGFTSKALGNLIVLKNHSQGQILTLVLGSEYREADTEKLLDWLFTAYKW